VIVFVKRICLLIAFVLLSFNETALCSDLIISDSHTFNTLVKKARYFEDQRMPDSALVMLHQAILVTQQSDSIAKVHLMIGNQYRLKNDFQTALKSVAIVENMSISGKLSDSILLIEKDHLAGKIYTDKGEYAKAIFHFDQCIVRAGNLKSAESVLLARIYNYKGITCYFMGENQKALSNYRIAKKICEELTISDMDFADILQNMAIVHSVEGHFDSAYHYINQSRKVREILLFFDDQRMASFYINYGRFLLLIGETDESLQYYLNAESLLLQQKDRDEVLFGMLCINIGNAHQLRGDYEKAMLYYQNAVNAFNGKLEENHPNLIAVTNNLAFTFNQMGDFESSLDISIQNLKKTLNPVSKVRLFHNLARSYRGLKDNLKAEEYLREAVNISGRQFGNQHYEYAVSVMDFADFLMINGRFEEAIINYEITKEIYASVFGANDMEVADAIRKSALCYISLGQFVKAETLFSNAEKILRGVNSENIALKEDLGNYSKIRLTDIYYGKADLFYRWYLETSDVKHLHKSFENNLLATGLLDGFSLALSDESQMLLNENLRSRYTQAIEVAYQLYVQTGETKYALSAFDYSGKSKAAVLLSSVRKTQAFSTVGVPEAVLNLERKLREDIMAFRKIRDEEKQKSIPNLDRIVYLESRQFETMRSYDSLLNHIELDYPDYFDLRYDPDVISLDKVQKQLLKDEVLLEYVLSDSVCYIFAISKDDFIFKKQSNADEIVESVIKFRTGITSDFTNHRRSDLITFVNRSEYLYNALLQPVHSLLSEKRLIIIPDGVLGYLPFELLIKSDSMHMQSDETSDYGSLSYLIKQHPVSYAYSSSLRFTEFGNKQRKGSKLLAVVPDYESGFNKTTSRKTIADSTPFFYPLPYALLESESVASIWGGKVLKDVQATKQNFIEQAKDFQILHLAMHTIIDDDDPLYSRLIFQKNNDSLDRYSLSTYELYALKLDAALVVLSACNTGVGQLRFGEGVMSLSRGFVYAGVPSLVMTSWEVHDLSGSFLTEQFYLYLRKGFSKDVALQKAKIDFLEQANLLKAHPFFWSAYMVIGDVSPIRSTWLSRNQMLILSFVLIVIAAFLGSVFYRKKKKKFQK
jgi:CHAT domain-containing protein